MNAMEAMGETPRERRQVSITSEIGRANVEISVRDMGPGLPMDIFDRLFTPFVTTKVRGLGIGLAIARNIVETHQGSIRARNHPEGGAEFTITLPINGARGALWAAPAVTHS
jgi:C4-dicarboxylate-specific signal transduction histidine kinase